MIEKHVADWFEKISVGLLVAGFFQTAITPDKDWEIAMTFMSSALSIGVSLAISYHLKIDEEVNMEIRRQEL